MQPPESKTCSNVSFTPEGQPPVMFGDVMVSGTFAPLSQQLAGIMPRETADITGPIGIRIVPTQIGHIPKFAVGQIGLFNATDSSAGVPYSVINAKVSISDAEVLVLDTNSSDGLTPPISFSRP
jgi:hypothetical protein